MRNLQRIQFAVANAAHGGEAFDQFIPAERKQASLWQTAALVAGPADALEQRGDGARGTELADQVNRPNVYPEFKRGGGDQGLEFAPLQTALGFKPQLGRKAAVMRGDLIRPQPLAQVMRHAFRESGAYSRRPASSGAPR